MLFFLPLDQMTTADKLRVKVRILDEAKADGLPHVVDMPLNRSSHKSRRGDLHRFPE
jgi:hypothetical protein